MTHLGPRCLDHRPFAHRQCRAYLEEPGVAAQYQARVSWKRRCRRGPGRRHHSRGRTAAGDRGACYAGGRVVYRAGRAQRIVMSGAYGMYDPVPPRAEATAMAQIAAAAGVPPGSIRAETRSRDTIGNIWFTKPLLGALAGQRVIVVTSDWHAARVRYLTRVIWGPGYRVAVEPVTGEADTRPPEEIACWEAGLLAVSRCWFAGIRPGDDAAIAAVLARDLPVYADHPQITLDELAALIADRRRDRG